MVSLSFNVLVYLFEMFIVFFFFSKNYKKRKSSVLIPLSLGVVLFTFLAVLFSFSDSIIQNILLFLLASFLFTITSFDIKFLSAIVQCFFLDALMFSSEVLVVFVISTITSHPIDAYQNDNFFYVLLTVISKVTFFVLSQLASFIIKKDHIIDFKSKFLTPLFIFPILTVFTCFTFLYIALENNLSPKFQSTIFSIIALFIFSCIFLFIYYQKLMENEAKINELESERKVNDINKAYLEILEHQNDELQMIFHDTKHHYMTLSNIGNINDVKSYIKELYPSLENKNKVRISNNKIIDLILNKYIVLCKNNGIKFSYEVKTSDLSYISDVELSIILNNALDNAIEAAKESDEKIIEFSIRHINNMDLVSIVNSCNSLPVHKGKTLFTTKKDIEKHGLGSKIIERHTRDNGGEFEWFYDEDEKRFHLSLIFQQ